MSLLPWGRPIGFEPFDDVRLEGTKDRGWGIGLSLARRIVEEHHGGQLVLADTDRGAAFDIILRG